MTLYTQNLNFDATTTSTRNSLIGGDNDPGNDLELRELYTDRYFLEIPIIYSIQDADGSYIALVENINLWGEGDSLLEAEKSLAKELISVYEDLKAHKRNELGPYPQDLLSFLKEHIKSEAT